MSTSNLGHVDNPTAAPSAPCESRALLVFGNPAGNGRNI